MTPLSQRFANQLPGWMRPEHPALRYELGRAPRPPARVRYMRALWVVLAGLLLLGAGYGIATDFLTQAAGDTFLEALQRTLYYPSLALQMILIAAAFSLTIGKIAREVRRQNWDTLRATPDGADLSLRARWAAVFYRLRGLLGVVLAVRVLLLLGLLWELTAFQGRYLDLLISGITPEIGLIVAVALLSMLMTAALLLPVTTVGLNAALGLLLSTMVRQRTYITLVQVPYIGLRVALAAGLVWAAAQFLSSGEPTTSTLAAWVFIAAAAAFGDWGLALLALGVSAEVWARVPYGVLISAALFGFALLQAAIADQLLRWAIRRAQRGETQ
jgi:hypothetical protein